MVVLFEYKEISNMPPYQINPINDYYFRNTQPQFPPQQQPHIVTRFVTNMEEAKAAMIDGVSTNLFLDSGTGKIYLKIGRASCRERV